MWLHNRSTIRLQAFLFKMKKNPLVMKEIKFTIILN